jgi:hypothetical protein
MGYLICEECSGYYKLQESESPEDFDLTCKCGGDLKFHKSAYNHFNNNSDLNEHSEIKKRESISIGESYAEKNSSRYNNYFIIGGIIGLIGLLGIIITHFSLIIILLGLSLLYYGYKEGKSWNKGIIGESIVGGYLNQLPKDYFIFNDVKFPGSYGNLDHIVIGPNGIFVIETKNYGGFYNIKGENWYYGTGKYPKKSKSQPGKQVKRNAMSLRKFLIDNKINMEGIWIDSIVTLVNNNFKIERRPTNYNVLFPAYLTDFIQLSNRKIDYNIIKESARLIEPYCIELSYLDHQIKEEIRKET